MTQQQNDAPGECPTCGFETPDYIKECPHCGEQKCSACDMGDDVGCPACDGDD